MQKLPSYTYTKAGYEKIKVEYDELLASRPAAVEDLSKARAMGDLKENGYYKAARMKLSSIDHRLRELKLHIRFGNIVEATQTDVVAVGNTVVVSDGSEERTFQIVGSHEANPSEGKISDRSPLGQALQGRKVGEIAEVELPSGSKKYTIRFIR